MMAGSDCDCLICRLEENLVNELSHDTGLEEYRLWAASTQLLSTFPTASELVGYLHRQQNDRGNSSVDEILLHLVGAGTNGTLHPIRERIVLLVFVPTIHRTTTQISAVFPLLGREDTAQHLFATLLDFLHSQELRLRRSHLAFAVARKMRRSAFRWAIREFRLDFPNDSDAAPAAAERIPQSGDGSHAGVLLAKFLDDCERRGWLSQEERQLLTQFKVEGVSSTELARLSRQSVGAIEQRIHRLLEKLRRIARKSSGGTPQQLDLFRP